MEAVMNFNLPLTFEQVAQIVKQLSKPEQQQIVALLQKGEKESVQTYFASEAALAQDWLSPEEDEAWKHL